MSKVVPFPATSAIPDDLLQIICTPPSTVRRPDLFMHVINRLKHDLTGPESVARFLAQYPEGIARDYLPDIEDAVWKFWDRAEVRVVAGELARVVDETEWALLAGGAPVFHRAGTLVTPVTTQVPAASGRTTTATRLQPLCATSLSDHAARVTRFTRYSKRSDAWVDTDPPRDAMMAMLVRRGSWRVPSVVGVITTPTLRPNGSVLREPGYDEETGLYLDLDPAFRLPNIPDRPTRQDAEAALRRLSSLLTGFPFASDVDRAVALSGLLTAVLRGTLPTAPLHAIRASTAGTGKSFLVDVASAIATGRHCPVIAAGKTEEETEKRLGALLRDGVPVVSIDNVNGELGGDMLCQMTERPLVRVRTLGKSEAPEIECRAMTFATGNNLTLVGDMTRRAVVCTLDAGVERPELREHGFDPVERVLSDRGTYVAAVLVIVRAYRAAGSPGSCGPIGSYGAWSKMVRAPLVWLGEADPVASMDAARDEDPDLMDIRELFEHWKKNPSLDLNCSRTVNEIIQAACVRRTEQYGVPGDFYSPEFRDLLLRRAGKGGAVNSAALGIWLKRIGGRVVGDMRLDIRPDPKRGNKYLLRSAPGTP